MFIILNWTDYLDIHVVRDQDGKTILFKTGNEAWLYATSELNPMWEVVEL